MGGGDTGSGAASPFDGRVAKENRGGTDPTCDTREDGDGGATGKGCIASEEKGEGGPPACHRRQVRSGEKMNHRLPSLPYAEGSGQKKSNLWAATAV